MGLNGTELLDLTADCLIPAKRCLDSKVEWVSLLIKLSSKQSEFSFVPARNKFARYISQPINKVVSGYPHAE